ncbi:MAG: hypothetical protein IJV46_06875 [Acidaminococcaceae bacterium]|nr:hypothetical protein [Acidaminococcaceae bacterium]
MKKVIAIAAILSTMLLANTAAAKYSDEYKAQYPKNVAVKTSQTKSGKMSTHIQYQVFKSPKLGGLSLTIHDIDGIKTCMMAFSYSGDRWHFYDKFSWGDGKEAHEEQLFLPPTRLARGGRVTEMIMTLANPAELKTAIVIHAHSERNGDELIMNETNKRWPEWKAALDAAEKLMNEK